MGQVPLNPSDSEQRILEDALLTRLAQQIHDRTVDARDLIRAMNREMHQRQMSSGKRVGVSWHLADALDGEQRVAATHVPSRAAQMPSPLRQVQAVPSKLNVFRITGREPWTPGWAQGQT